MKVCKTDPRHSNVKGFKFYVRFFNESAKDDAKLRECLAWCTDAFGPSSLLLVSGSKNTKWAYTVDSQYTRILLSTDRELSWFMLKWSHQCEQH